MRCSGVLHITGIAVLVRRHTVRTCTYRRGLLQQVAPGCASWIFTASMGGGSTASAGKLCQHSVTLAVKKVVNTPDLEQLSLCSAFLATVFEILLPCGGSCWVYTV